MPKNFIDIVNDQLEDLFEEFELKLEDVEKSLDAAKQEQQQARDALTKVEALAKACLHESKEIIREMFGSSTNLSEEQRTAYKASKKSLEIASKYDAAGFSPVVFENTKAWLRRATQKVDSAQNNRDIVHFTLESLRAFMLRLYARPMQIGLDLPAAKENYESKVASFDAAELALKEHIHDPLKVHDQKTCDQLLLEFKKAERLMSLAKIEFLIAEDIVSEARLKKLEENIAQQEGEDMFTKRKMVANPGGIRNTSGLMDLVEEGRRISAAAEEKKKIEAAAKEAELKRQLAELSKMMQAMHNPPVVVVETAQEIAARAERLAQAKIANRRAKFAAKINPSLERMLETVDVAYQDKVRGLLADFSTQYIVDGNPEAIAEINGYMLSIDGLSERTADAVDTIVKPLLDRFEKVAAKIAATANRLDQARLANRQAKFEVKLKPSLNRLLGAVEPMLLEQVLAQQKFFADQYIAGDTVIVAAVDECMNAIAAVSDKTTVNIDAIVKACFDKCLPHLESVTKVTKVPGKAVLHSFDSSAGEHLPANVFPASVSHENKLKA